MTGALIDDRSMSERIREQVAAQQEKEDSRRAEEARFPSPRAKAHKGELHARKLKTRARNRVAATSRSRNRR